MPLNINKYMKRKKRNCLDKIRLKYRLHQRWVKKQYNDLEKNRENISENIINNNKDNNGYADSCVGCGCLIIFILILCLIFPPLWNFSPILAIILALILFG